MGCMQVIGPLTISFLHSVVRPIFHDFPNLHFFFFLSLYRYLYNETVNLQSVMTALTTLYAAHKYMCPGLAKQVKTIDGYLYPKPVFSRSGTYDAVQIYM